MSAFLICDVEVKNREKLQEYLQLSEPTLAPFGGYFHAQAGETVKLEGDWDPKVVVIAEFPSMQSAQDWYRSAEYAKALKIKPGAMTRNMIVTTGLSG